MGDIDSKLGNRLRRLLIAQVSAAHHLFRTLGSNTRATSHLRGLVCAARHLLPAATGRVLVPVPTMFYERSTEIRIIVGTFIDFVESPGSQSSD